jgi:polyhydroxybutyrate depolymerase
MAAILIGLPVLIVASAVASITVLDRTNGTLRVGDQEREYLLHVPASYDPLTPTPLVISMHGAALWPAHQMHTSGWNRLAEEHGFIVVYPSGTGMPKIWHAQPGADPMRDVKFIAALIDTIRSGYNIDSTRIYANGLSNGGGMAFVLSCALADRIAAIGTVAAAQALPMNWCTDQRPVPAIFFHGTADRVVPYSGGLSWASPRPFPSVLTWTAEWARRNGCEHTPVETQVAMDVTRLQYSSCTSHADVVLYTIIGGGHSWPGGRPMPKWLAGVTNFHIDATSQMYAFFREHPLVSQ